VLNSISTLPGWEENIPYNNHNHSVKSHGLPSYFDKAIA